MDKSKLFFDLLNAETESKVQVILENRSLIDNGDCWHPLGNNNSNFGVIENQQSTPVAAIVEKVTNGIDAILERRCLEEGIDPRSADAPRSIEDALNRFFPKRKDWDIQKARRKQAQEIQIIADGPKMGTSLLIYDNGIGQKPNDFPGTFLSILKGNKNDIHFVQGKYNMGGTGAIAFCGDLRYQLIASKHYEGNDKLGFTLIRQHPWTGGESKKYKLPWYEYLVLNGEIPSIEIGETDVGLEERNFRTGSLIKLYSFQLPPGARSVISRDLNRSLNELLYEPALPFLTIDNEKRYPEHRALSTVVYGLKHRFEPQTGNDVIEDKFSLKNTSSKLGEIGVEVIVFRVKSRGKNVKETKNYIRTEFFSNNMSVLFSLNGQVHGSFTSEFISRSLKLNLLRDYVLIHVNCDKLKPEIIKELFMASRDRLKGGDKMNKLRKKLKEILSDSPLKTIEKNRKANLNIESKQADDILKDLCKNLSMNETFSKLLQSSLTQPDLQSGVSNKKEKTDKKKGKDGKPKPKSFNPKRFPSSFKLKSNDGDQDGTSFIKLPVNGKRTINFQTDVENDYFNRVDEPGEMKIIPLSINNHKHSGNGTGGDGGSDTGGSSVGITRKPSEILDIGEASPSEGTIKVNFNPTEKAQVGDIIEMQATLSSPNGNFEEIFLINISDQETKTGKPKPEPTPDLKLPKLVLCSQNGDSEKLAWDKVEEIIGKELSHQDVVRFIRSDEDDQHLGQIVINVESNVFLNYRRNLKNQELIESAEKRFISLVYFHSLFLYTTSKMKRYNIKDQSGEKGVDIEIDDYISEIFKDTYAQFLINFDMNELKEILS